MRDEQIYFADWEPPNSLMSCFMQRADGMQRAEGWLVFWRGLGSGEAIVRAFRSAVGEPVSFVESKPAVGEGVAVG